MTASPITAWPDRLVATVFTVGQGDTVMLPQGTPCARHSRVPVSAFSVAQQAVG